MTDDYKMVEKAKFVTSLPITDNIVHIGRASHRPFIGLNLKGYGVEGIVAKCGKSYLDNAYLHEVEGLTGVEMCPTCFKYIMENDQ